MRTFSRYEQIFYFSTIANHVSIDSIASDLLTINITDKEVWRLRIDNWWIIYAVKQTDRTRGVIAARKRPPYEYGD